MDRFAVIWTQAPAGCPIKMGHLVVTQTEARFSYAEEFLDSNHPAGLALLASPALYRTRPVVHPRSEALPLHLRLIAMVPPHGVNNIQRRVYASLLHRRERHPAPGFDTDWEMLLLAGRNGIGHLDIFRNDAEASAWYGKPAPAKELDGTRSGLWGLLKSVLNQALEETDADLASVLGPTPPVAGMIPKLLVAVPGDAPCSGRVAPAGTRTLDGRAYIDVLLKIEPPGYEGLVDLEALALTWHAEQGFDVPRHWTTIIDGMRVLMVERFDRQNDGTPLPMESFYSVMASGAEDIRFASDADMGRVGRMLGVVPRLIHIEVKQAQLEVYRRFCAAVLTGNSDLHLDNLSFLGGPDVARVAPVYDPAPMRAWTRHNLLSAISFGSDGTREGSLLTVSAYFGLSKYVAAEHLHSLRESTRELPDRVMALCHVPLETRERLADVLREVRTRTAMAMLRRPVQVTSLRSS